MAKRTTNLEFTITNIRLRDEQMANEMGDAEDPRRRYEFERLGELMRSAKNDDGWIAHIRKEGAKDYDQDFEFYERCAGYFADEIDKFFANTPVLTSTREANRKFIDFFEETQEKMELPFHMLLNGSQADGIRNYSDIDIMYCFNDFVVVEAPNSRYSDNQNAEIPEGSEDKWVLMLETENCYPCYARLRLYRPASDMSQFKELFTEVDDAYYLNKDGFLQYARVKGLFPEGDPFELHGPAFNRLEEQVIGRPDTDYVACIKANFWPRNARSSTMMSHLIGRDDPQKQKKCLESMRCVYLVPTAYSESIKPEVEFRISFSACERFIHQNWSDDKLKLFVTCKLLTKQYLTMKGLKDDGKIAFKQTEQFMEGQKSLCSYHIKTMMYWYLEGKRDAEFKNIDMYAAFVKFLKYVFFDAIMHQTLPHYFVEEHDLFGAFSERDFIKYFKMFLANSLGLPDTVSVASKTVLTPRQKMEELLFSRLVEIAETRGEVGCMIYFGHNYALHAKFTGEYFERVTEGMIDVKTPLGVMMKSMQTRCAAIYTMCDALSGNVTDDQKALLLLASEQKFKHTLRIDGALLDDYGALGHAYLAVFYYASDRTDECLQRIEMAFDAYDRCGQLFFNFYTWNRIIIPAGKHGQIVPAFFADDPIKYLYFINNRARPILVDMIVMLRYLHLRLTGTALSRSCVREYPMDKTERLHSNMLENIMLNYRDVLTAMNDTHKSREILSWLNGENVKMVDTLKAIGAGNSDLEEQGHVRVLSDWCIDESTRENTLSRLYSAAVGAVFPTDEVTRGRMRLEEMLESLEEPGA